MSWVRLFFFFPTAFRGSFACTQDGGLGGQCTGQVMMFMFRYNK